MGLEAIYPKPKRSAAGRGHRIYPYLQRGLGRYIPYYNAGRPHQSLDYRTPAAVYGRGQPGGKAAG
jgi:hypothetical protein